MVCCTLFRLLCPACVCVFADCSCVFVFVCSSFVCVMCLICLFGLPVFVVYVLMSAVCCLLTVV